MLEQKIKMEEFCDMEQLSALLDNWSRSTGMAAVVIDMEGKDVFKSFGMTEFCSMMHQSKEGAALCSGVWRVDMLGIYECPMGLYDTCIPLVLPDGTNIGRVMAGQIITDEQDESGILEKTGKLGLDEAQVSGVLSRMKRKPRREMESAFLLLRQMLSFFIEKSYHIRESQREQENEKGAQSGIFFQGDALARERLFSGVAKMHYSFNLRVNMETGRYTLVTGTGSGSTVEFMKTTDEYAAVYDYLIKAVDKAYRKTGAALLDIERIREHRGEVGYLDSCELMIHNDDSVEWYELSVFTDVDESVTPIFNVLGHDVTGEHDRADTLAKLESAKRANEEKSRFLSNMSHDIRTPLNGIIGMTEIADSHIDDRERVKDCLGKISAAGKHLLSLINDILDLSKIESGSIALAEETFSISELLDNVVAMISSQMRSKDQQLSFHIDKVTHEMVIGDAVKLRRVFTNILSNAVKYTPEGGSISVTFSEKPADSPEAAKYEFICADNGYGMSEDTLQKLFEPFERAPDERVRNIQGTGLGMAITRNIVRMMGGDIAVESRLDAGSKFTVGFCLKIQEDDGLFDDRLAHLKLLVVDEDISVCESVCMEAEELGVEADYVLSGKEAVRTAEKRLAEGDGIDVCLVDCKFPITDETDIIRGLRETAWRNLKIIVMSTCDWADIEQEARRAGADAFVSKPLFKYKLFEKLKEVVLGEEQEREKPDALSAYSERDFSDKRLLLVEDVELNREVACSILHETKINVETAENGRIALEMIERSPEGYYDMVLMDVRMPVMDGLEATRRIRRLGRYDVRVMPIIATSANAFLEDIAKSREAGMNDHITKPINLKKLLDIMEYYLGDHMAKKKETASYRTDVSPTKYYEEIYFANGATELSPQEQQACIEALNRNGAVGIIGMLEEPGLPMFCVSGFALVALGYTYEELMTVSRGCFINLVYPEDRDKVIKTFYNRGHKYSFRVIGKNGEIINVVAYTSDPYLFDGQKVRMTSVRVIAI